MTEIMGAWGTCARACVHQSVGLSASCPSRRPPSAPWSTPPSGPELCIDSRLLPCDGAAQHEVVAAPTRRDHHVQHEIQIDDLAPGAGRRGQERR